MSANRWTDTLREPLAGALAGSEWLRVEESRDSGWLALAENATGADTSWYTVTEHELASLNPLEDRRLKPMRPALSAWLGRGWGVRLLAWRVGSRAIFSVETANGPRIAKVYRKNRRLPERWGLLDPSPGWRVPRVLDWDEEHCVLTLEHCPGESLNRRWLTGRGRTEDAERIADCLEWLADAAPPPGFPAHDVEDEVRVLTERLEVFERCLQEPDPRARSLTDRVVEALRTDPVQARVLCHRDFHDKQVLLDEDAGYLIDFDLAAVGPPALDVGNILAHLRLRELKGAALPWRDLAGSIVARVSPARRIEKSLHRWTAASLMRLALIYARRRRGPALVRRLLESTEQALARDGEWRGIL